MRRPRKSHVQKTPEDRENYYSTKIGGVGPSPTLDTQYFDQDSTAAVIPTSDVESTATTQRTARSSALSTFLKEKGLEVLVVVIILGGLGFIVLQLFSFNRELGEFKAREEQREKDSERSQERLQSDVNRINDRLDRLTEHPKK